MFSADSADLPCEMKCAAAFVVVAVTAFGGEAPPAGITGTVRVTTTLTKKRITVPQVYERGVAIASPKASAPDVEAELRRVVIYLEGTKLAAKPARATMNQMGRRFEPEVLAVPAGSTVGFPNSDPIFHNVFSLSDAKPFDLGNYKEGDTRLVTFDRAGVVQVHCHLHANMSGAILVTPNAWLAQPGPSGAYSLPPVPPGRYTAVAWHKTAGFFRREIEVAEGRALSVDFEIPVLASSSR